MSNKVDEIYDIDYFFGAVKSGYHDYAKVDYILYELAKILDNTFNPKSIVDLGCAYNFLIDYLIKNKGIKGKGYDISNYAVSHSPNAYLADMTKSIPESDNSFELVFTSQVLEHLPENSLSDVLKEMYRISSKYVVILCGMWEKENIPKDGKDESDSTHITFKSRKWWENKVRLLKMKRNVEKEKELDDAEYSKTMNWSGSFIVIEK